MLLQMLLKSENKLEDLGLLICIFAFPVLIGMVYFEDLFRFFVQS